MLQFHCAVDMFIKQFQWLKGKVVRCIEVMCMSFFFFFLLLSFGLSIYLLIKCNARKTGLQLYSLIPRKCSKTLKCIEINISKNIIKIKVVWNSLNLNALLSIFLIHKLIILNPDVEITLSVTPSAILILTALCKRIFSSIFLLKPRT